MDKPCFISVTYTLPIFFYLPLDIRNFFFFTLNSFLPQVQFLGSFFHFLIKLGLVNLFHIVCRFLSTDVFFLFLFCLDVDDYSCNLSHLYQINHHHHRRFFFLLIVSSSSLLNRVTMNEVHLIQIFFCHLVPLPYLPKRNLSNNEMDKYRRFLSVL